MHAETGSFFSTAAPAPAPPPPARAPLQRPPIPAIVQQHAEEAAHLRHVRSVLLRAPHVRLLQLQRLDDRIEAHLDGLAVAGAYGLARAQAALERLGCGEVFAALAAALAARDTALQQQLLALAPAAPEAWRGVVSAFGWSTPGLLRDAVRSLLAAPADWQRALGLEACRLHRVDPGPPLAAALRSTSPLLRQAAVRCAAELGRHALAPLVLAALPEAEQAGALPLAAHAAHAACLLGDRGAALQAVERLAFATPAACDRLRPLAVQLLPPARTREHLRGFAQAGGGALREAVRTVGWLGDPAFVPWLLERMADPRLARVAGEAFSAITGADLAALDLEGAQPEGFAAGPSDDPDDEDVALDDDESLPWPDPARMQRWWQAQAPRFPAGRRCCVGGPAAPEHLQQVLREGSQRQRALAAQQLVLLQPGQPLFPLAAPAWRQKRLLGLARTGA
ncbi:TIGR02270 family protein [Pseudorhodoferax sp.]|uniref:TIGR02270 family protein n=1 Tax=Pseudorhodoferax sp. TaxID=1993553 RepID=UPI0039E4C4F1